MSAAAVAEAVAAFGSERRQVRFLYFVTVGTPTPTSTIMAADQRRGLLELAQRLSRELGQRVLLVLDQAIRGPDPRPGGGTATDAGGMTRPAGRRGRPSATHLLWLRRVAPHPDAALHLMQAAVQYAAAEG